MNKLKYISTLALSLTSIASFTSHAEISANIAVDSNYYWRGISQTQDATAVSGGLDYNHDSGFYAGTWASNIDFGDMSPSYELDFYAGYSGTSGDINYDLGYIYYAYPDANNNIDFSEVYGELAWQWLSGKLSYLSHAQSDATTEEDMLYVELNAQFEILNQTELAFHIGHSSGDTVSEWYGEDDSYLDYGVSMSKSGFTFRLTKTDLSANDDIKVSVGYSLDFDL